VSYNIIIFVQNAGTYISIFNGIFKFNFLTIVVSEISGGHKFIVGGHAPPRRHLAVFIPSEYFTTCNCVFNFNFLAPVVSETIGAPKFTLRGPAPPDAP